eukprot:8922202-Pyramimonas_sp.AAC.1
MGITTATLLLDLAKFYDSISVVKLVQHALEQGYPPIVLCLEVQMHLAPRLLKERQWVSREIQPWRSILAGSPEG